MTNHLRVVVDNPNPTPRPQMVICFCGLREVHRACRCRTKCDCGKTRCLSCRITSESTDQGEQIVLPGAGRSAHQAAAAREAAGHGKIKPKAQQQPAGGMFAITAPAPDLFGDKK